MIKAGIILIAVQILGIIGTIVNGTFGEGFGFSSGEEVGTTIGFFLLGIIGIVLLVVGLVKKQKLAKTQAPAPDQDSAPQQ